MPIQEIDPASPDEPQAERSPTVVTASSPLAHLSPEKIEEVYQRYLQGEKTAELLKEYDIKTKLNSLVKLLPPLVRNDLVCPFCSATALQRRPAKSGSPPLPGCIGCAHVYVTGNDRCGCTGCKSAYINELNGAGMSHRVPYSDLTIRHKIILLSTLALTEKWEEKSFSFYKPN